MKRGTSRFESAFKNKTLPNSKRSQITAFIIIALLIVISLASFFVIKNIQKDSSKDPFQNQADSIVESTLDCFNQVYLNSLMVAGFQGGYTNVTDGLYNGFAVIPYYYKEGKSNIPTLNKIETEIENYVDSVLPQCLNYNQAIVDSEELGLNLTTLDLMEGNYQGYNVHYKEYNTKVKIANSRVTFTTDLDLIIESEDNRYTFAFKEHPLNFASDLSNMHEIASYITNSLAQNSESICLTCVEDLAVEKNLNVEIMNYLNPQDELVMISNNLTSTPFIFQYLNKYSEKNEELS